MAVGARRHLGVRKPSDKTDTDANNNEHDHIAFLPWGTYGGEGGRAEAVM